MTAKWSLVATWWSTRNQARAAAGAPPGRGAWPGFGISSCKYGTKINVNSTIFKNYQSNQKMTFVHIPQNKASTQCYMNKINHVTPEISKKTLVHIPQNKASSQGYMKITLVHSSTLTQLSTKKRATF